MDWYKKTDKQYDSHKTLIWGGDSDTELSLSEDDESLIHYLMQYALNELRDEYDHDYALEHLPIEQIEDFRKRWGEADILNQQSSDLHMRSSAVVGELTEEEHRQLMKDQRELDKRKPWLDQGEAS